MRRSSTAIAMSAFVALLLVCALPAEAQRVLTGNSGQRNTNSGREGMGELDITRGTASDFRYSNGSSNNSFDFYETGSGGNRYSFIDIGAGRGNDVSAVNNDVSGSYGGPLNYYVYVKPAPSGPPTGTYSQAANIRIDEGTAPAYRRAVREHVYIDPDMMDSPDWILDHDIGPPDTPVEQLAYGFGAASAAIIKAAIPEEEGRGWTVRYRNGDKPYRIVYVGHDGQRRTTPR